MRPVGYSPHPRRSHPVTIFFSLGRVLYLIVIPILRGVIISLQGGIVTWASGAWLDSLILVFMLAFAFMSWRRCTYECTPEYLSVKRGVFFSRRTCIPWEHISALSCTSPLLLRPLRASILSAGTIAGSPHRPDMSLYIHTISARGILEIFRNKNPQTDSLMTAPTGHYAPKAASIAAFALLSSNTPAGIIFLATFISQAGRILGREFPEMIFGTFEMISREFAMGIPPAAAAIAYALLLGWFTALLLIITRYHKLTVWEQNAKISVSAGLLTRRAYVVSKSHIHFIDIRQTIGTLLLRLHTMYIQAPGYASKKDDISCLISAKKKSDFMRVYEDFFPDYMPAERQLKPARRGILGYVWQPLLLCAAMIAAAVLLYLHFPPVRDFILFASLMSLVPGLLFLAVRLADFRSGGIARQNGAYTLRYSRGMRMHTVIAPEKNIAKITLRQSPMQRWRGRCNLTMRTMGVRGVRGARHICRNMIRDQILDMDLAGLG